MEELKCAEQRAVFLVQKDLNRGTSAELIWCRIMHNILTYTFFCHSLADAESDAALYFLLQYYSSTEQVCLLDSYFHIYREGSEDQTGHTEYGALSRSTHQKTLHCGKSCHEIQLLVRDNG